MIKDSKLIIKISLIVFLISFSLLFFIDKNYILDKKEIKNITIKDINKYVRIEGEIVKQKSIGEHVQIEIKDNTSTIKGTLFYSNSSFRNKNYSIIGKITMYNKKLGLIVSEIEEI